MSGIQVSALAPGVYRQDILPAAPVDLPTGIAGFVGFTAAPGPVEVSDPRMIAGIADPAVSYLPAVLAGFFANGGIRCHVAGASATAADGESALGAALDRFAGIDEIDIVAMPDAMRLQAGNGTPDAAAIQRSQGRLLAHCAANGRRFAILDSLPAASAATVTAQRQAVAASAAEPVSGALYYPWPVNGAGLLVPPCGHVAGVYAATDAAHGVARAPAGGVLLDVTDLETGIDAGRQAPLNTAGVNCLRALPARGIRVWGARTVSALPEWRYVNVRRLVLTVCRWTDRNLARAAFEPNTPATRARIRRVLTAYLTQLWDSGALQGATAAAAFQVVCDDSNNTANMRDAGQLFVDISLAPSSPAEFVVVRLALQPDTAS
jgi:hypothetical protein